MKVNFTEYKQILEAERVGIHDLLGHFKKDNMDYDQWGNIYVNFSKDTKGTPIMVAHTDNVLHGERKPALTLDGKRIFGAGGVGIGFDDKAGIIGAIEIWKRMKKKGMRLIFTAEEEVGGIGARHVPAERIEDAAYIVELDRRGRNDLIQTSGYTRLASDEFAKIWEDLGFKKAAGTFTDLNELKETAPEVNMVNLSIGYYNAHTDDEYLEIAEFEDVVDKVFSMISTHPDKIVDDTPPEPKSKYTGYGRDYGNYGNYSRYGGIASDINGMYDKYYDECANCGAMVRKDDGVEDEDGNVFCDDICMHEYEKFVKTLNDDDDTEA